LFGDAGADGLVLDLLREGTGVVRGGRLAGVGRIHGETPRDGAPGAAPGKTSDERMIDHTPRRGRKTEAISTRQKRRRQDDTSPERRGGALTGAPGLWKAAFPAHLPPGVSSSCTIFSIWKRSLADAWTRIWFVLSSATTRRRLPSAPNISWITFAACTALALFSMYDLKSPPPGGCDSVRTAWRLK